MATSSYYCSSFRSTAPLSTLNYESAVYPRATRHLRPNCAVAARLAAATVTGDEKVVVRRSANYGAPIYDFQSIQSLNNGYSEEKYLKRADELKEQVDLMLKKDMPSLECLEMVENLERLGLASHFEPQLYTKLNRLHIIRTTAKCYVKPTKEDLYAVALEFRMLRKHGFQVSPDIFIHFMNEEGEFDDSLSEDIKGMLSLYEASFLSMEGETILEMAREFAVKHLKKCELKDSSVLHALESPQWWRVPRTETIWYLREYETRPNMNPMLLEFAQLDFNIVQSTHQQELKSLSRWFKNTRAIVHLTFTRDRIVECFYAAAVMFPEAKYSSCRRMIGKIIANINMVDDIYDVYGTLEELELFTDAIERWDVTGMDQLPNYMRVAYLLLFNTVNEMAYNVLKEQGVHVIEYLKKGWCTACKVYMQEARWYYSGYTPTVEEYLENGLVSIGTPILLLHEYVEMTNHLNMEALSSFDSDHLHPIIRCASVLMRLVDDLGTSTDEMKRGDVPKIVQCYMKEMRSSNEEGREYAWNLYTETWKTLNKASMDVDSDFPFSPAFVSAVRRLINVTHATYQHEDALVLYQDPETSRNVHATFFSPISVSAS